MEKTITRKIEIQVKITGLSENVPEELLEHFNEWLIAKGMEVGTGRHSEYYHIDEFFENDIYVHFYVTYNTIRNDEF